MLDTHRNTRDEFSTSATHHAGCLYPRPNSGLKAIKRSASNKNQISFDYCTTRRYSPLLPSTPDLEPSESSALLPYKILPPLFVHTSTSWYHISSSSSCLAQKVCRIKRTPLQCFLQTCLLALRACQTGLGEEVFLQSYSNGGICAIAVGRLCTVMVTRLFLLSDASSRSWGRLCAKCSRSSTRSSAILPVRLLRGGCR